MSDKASYRSAVTGRFVSGATADRNPNTTIKENLKPKTEKGAGSSKAGSSSKSSKVGKKK